MARSTRRSCPTTTRLIWNSASSREAASSGPLMAAGFLDGGIFAPSLADRDMLDYECERPLKPSWLYLWSSSAFPQAGHRPSRWEEDGDDERRQHPWSRLAPGSMVFRTTPVLGRPDVDRGRLSRRPGRNRCIPPGPPP